MTTPAPGVGPDEPRTTEIPPAEPAPATEQPPAPIRPANNIGWAVASLLFFWPLSFSAFTHAFNVFPLWTEGDVDGARHASQRARYLGILSLCIGGALFVIFAVLYLGFMLLLMHHGHHGHHGNWGGPGPRMRRG
ncbi:CD225/dispanin family protein [Nocardia yunnanensis]|uniref:CD225/dispanin family protein n=1 Tax=Nocardia yunnanensis TaxID=2382165 RepID=A0A386ZM70_9NOCA|nr:CD225/dispanin family protein [Nocardia yunnanensis]AYF77759.1 CD225/dispanin family protein [Nocardia yunnanensis]